MGSVHVRLGYNEAVASKKDVLLSEMSLLNIMKHMKSYKTLRKKDLILRNKIKKELATIRTTISKIEMEFPKDIEIPKDLEEEEEMMEEEEEILPKKSSKKSKKTKKKDSIEEELKAIKEKLARLG